METTDCLADLFLIFFSGKEKGCLCLSGNGIVLGAAVYTHQPEGMDLVKVKKSSSQDDNGICSAPAGHFSGMTAKKPRYLQIQNKALSLVPLSSQNNDLAGTAGTACCQNAFLVGIQVQHSSAPDQRSVQSLGSQHANLFIYGEDAFQSGVQNGRIIQNGQHVGYCYAIVAAQSGAVCRKPLSVGHQRNSLCIHIQFYTGILFTDHIHMTLRDQNGCILTSFGSICIDHYIARFILHIFISVVSGKSGQIVADGICMIGTVRDRSDLSEETEDFSRLYSGKVIGVLPVVLKLRGTGHCARRLRCSFFLFRSFFFFRSIFLCLFNHLICKRCFNDFLFRTA